MTTPTFGSAHAVALALHALLRHLQLDEIAHWDDLPELTEEQWDLVDQELHRLPIRIQGEIDEHERWNGLNALDLWERYS